jgi:hypothetical protein
MSDKTYHFLVYLLLGGVVVLGALGFSKFCNEKLAKEFSCVDPDAGRLYHDRLEATSTLFETGQLEEASK